MKKEKVRVLEIITVPFFTNRGTSFSSFERTRAMSEFDYELDVIAYSIGEDIDLSNVSIHRIPRIPFISEIKMGPSFKKLVLDIFLMFKTFWFLAFKGKYDFIHVHEEAVYWCALTKFLHRTPILYDMHSSLVEQLENFGFSKNGLIRGIFDRLERFSIARSDAIIVICPELENRVKEVGTEASVHLIENLPVAWDIPKPDSEEIGQLRQTLNLGEAPVLLYTGTFGKNQGLDLALHAAKKLSQKDVAFKLLLIGGRGEDLATIHKLASELDLLDDVLFIEPLPYTEMPKYMALADILLSPRTTGTNTPLKIYAYINSGKPVVATDLHTHTQVLNQDVAVLVKPSAQDLSDGIEKILTDESYAQGIAGRALTLAQEKYGIERYRKQTKAAVSSVLN